jgi:hypothetical protein
MTQPTTITAWRSRITRTGTIDPGELVANPANWRQHPRHQHDALRELLGQVGWVQGVVVNERTGHLVDGHLRAELAVADGAPAIPAVWVELSDDEERLVLAALDPVGDLAVADAARLEALLATLDVGGEALQGLFDDLISVHGAYQPGEDGELPGERDFWPFVRFQVSRETLALFEHWWPTVDGADDDAKLRGLMGL